MTASSCWALFEDVVPHALVPSVEELIAEISWTQCCHKGGALPRLLAVQGARTEQGWIPIYLHPLDPPIAPVDEFSPSVFRIKEAVEAKIGCSFSFNHVLIQLYRDGNDYISDHSDKTLDLHPASLICSYSIGARRAMILKPKKARVTGAGAGAGVRVPLPSNSLFVLPLAFNRTHTHGIKPDRRAERDKQQDEEGPRVSLTFRTVATFFCPETRMLVGQGASPLSESSEFEDESVGEGERERLLLAFSRENKTDADWDELYGGGFPGLDFAI